MSETKRKYDSTVARIAGNIASGFVGANGWPGDNAVRLYVAESAVALARAIVEEVQRTEPEAK